MDRIDGKEIKSKLYGITGTFIQEEGKGLMLKFTYKKEEINLPFEMVMNNQTVSWMETIGEMMIEDCIRKIQSEEKMDSLFSGGVGLDE